MPGLVFPDPGAFPGFFQKEFLKGIFREHPLRCKSPDFLLETSLRFLPRLKRFLLIESLPALRLSEFCGKHQTRGTDAGEFLPERLYLNAPFLLKRLNFSLFLSKEVLPSGIQGGAFLFQF